MSSPWLSVSNKADPKTPDDQNPPKFNSTYPRLAHIFPPTMSINK